MTTPERLKRRQRFIEWMLSIYVVVVGISLIAVTVYFNGRQDEQQECMNDNFAELADALTARGELAQQDSMASLLEAKATRKESETNDTFFRAVFAAETSEEAQAAFREQQAALVKVNAIRAKVDEIRTEVVEQREKNPIPAFPEGTCQ